MRLNADRGWDIKPKLKLIVVYIMMMIVQSMCTIYNFPSRVNIVSFYCYFGTFTSERGKVLLFSLGVLYFLYGWLITKLQLLTSMAYPTMDGGHVLLLLPFHHLFIHVTVNNTTFFNLLSRGVWIQSQF